MIQIILDEDGNPQKAGYSQHYGGAKRQWDDVNKVDGTHPKVYIAKSSHASYYTSGTDNGEIDDGFSDLPDDHSGGGKCLKNDNADLSIQEDGEYHIHLIDGQDWLNFKGRWGEQVHLTNIAGKSPHSPTSRHSHPWNGLTSDYWYRPEAYMWIEPVYWMSILK
ncbi:MAG: hypothetical protein ACQEQM_06870 [Thermoplasmatota archaeon]